MLNSVGAVPVMVMMMRLTMRRLIIAGFTLPLPLATAAMAVTVVAMIASWLE